MNINQIMISIAGGLASYLLGAIPFSLLVGFAVGNKDIREEGSGNTGATNLARTVNYPTGLLGLILDVGKGFAPAFWFGPLVIYLSGINGTLTLQWVQVSYGFLAIIGHCFPVYLLFSGGKGVATSLGVFVALAPVPTLLAFAVWLITLLVGGWVSLASMTGAAGLPLLHYLYHNVIFPSDAYGGITNPVLLFSAIAATLVVVRHHENISRLLSGDEEKFYESLQSTNKK